MNILVVKFSSLGDIVLVTPCLEALRARWPAARIVVAVNRAYAPLLECCPEVDAVLLRDPAERPFRRLKTLMEGARARFRAGCRFDLALDLQGKFHSVALTSLVRARQRAGLGRRDRRPRAPSDAAVHAVDEAAAVLEQVGVPVRQRTPRLVVPRGFDRAAEEFLRDRGLPTRGYLLLHPGTSVASKEWPVERYAEVVRRLVCGGAGPPTVLVTGSAAEVAKARAVCATVASPRAVSVAGELPLGPFIALCARAAAFLGGDTGPMHVSAATGVPVVALFGPTLPEASGPVGGGHRVVQVSRPAEPDASGTPGAHAHMLAIPVDAVHAAVAAALCRAA